MQVELSVVFLAEVDLPENGNIANLLLSGPIESMGVAYVNIKGPGDIELLTVGKVLDYTTETVMEMKDE